MYRNSTAYSGRADSSQTADAETCRHARTPKKQRVQTRNTGAVGHRQVFTHNETKAGRATSADTGAERSEVRHDSWANCVYTPDATRSKAKCVASATLPNSTPNSPDRAYSGNSETVADCSTTKTKTDQQAEFKTNNLQRQ